MYRVVPSKNFRKQVKRLVIVDKILLKKLNKVIDILCAGESPPQIFQDHKLSGKFKDFRECHIAPDWLLVYCLHKDIPVLELLATGSLATLFE